MMDRLKEKSKYQKENKAMLCWIIIWLKKKKIPYLRPSRWPSDVSEGSLIGPDTSQVLPWSRSPTSGMFHLQWDGYWARNMRGKHYSYVFSWTGGNSRSHAHASPLLCKEESLVVYRTILNIRPRLSYLGHNARDPKPQNVLGTRMRGNLKQC